ncbi:hypothetical protein [Roseateles amylovorans]|uniref:DUF1579 domain-containing protein n=1 Tax=Roseateles amylovorans TaxID=2978473 RepID=A0ABY6AT87_9BURK|nr:hypothetical protein [Roseateles amylovorans]UXH76042.1 hypothetical protein N4261_13245 [Roseateles amylovorans]
MQRRLLLLTLGLFAARPASALYDPKPLAFLESALGHWAGTLTYRDYQKPDRMVTLKTVMTASLAAPDELALYYVFDDGPGKTVYSYERMKFDLAGHQMIWNTGISKPNRVEYKISARPAQDGGTALDFEKAEDGQTDQYAWEVTPRSWRLTKYEVSGSAEKRLRSKYELAKREG